VTEADPLTLAIQATRCALGALRLQTFTGVLILTWQDGALTRLASEGVSTFTADPPRWQVAHSRAVQAVRVWGPLAGARVVVQLRAGVPVGTHLDTLP
jgi:hypothetical protein